MLVCPLICTCINTTLWTCLWVNLFCSWIGWSPCKRIFVSNAPVIGGHPMSRPSETNPGCLKLHLVTVTLDTGAARQQIRFPPIKSKGQRTGTVGWPYGHRPATVRRPWGTRPMFFARAEPARWTGGGRTYPARYPRGRRTGAGDSSVGARTVSWYRSGAVRLPFGAHKAIGRTPRTPYGPGGPRAFPNLLINPLMTVRCHQVSWGGH